MALKRTRERKYERDEKDDEHGRDEWIEENELEDTIESRSERSPIIQGNHKERGKTANKHCKTPSANKKGKRQTGNCELSGSDTGLMDVIEDGGHGSEQEENSSPRNTGRVGY